MRNSTTKGKKIYVMSNDHGQCKIGMTSDLKQRLSAIRCGQPSASVEFSSKTLNNYAEVERACHKMLSNHSAGGEWFSLNHKSAIKTVRGVIADIGVFQDSKDTFDRELFESNLKQIKVTASGYLSSALSKSNGAVIFEYCSLIAEIGDNDYLKSFYDKDCSEQYVIASSYFANQYLKLKSGQQDGM